MHVTQLYFKKQDSQKGRNEISGSCKYSQSTAETAMQYKTVFTTCDWHNVASLANMKCGPYFINQLTFMDFKDYKKQRKTAMANTNHTLHGFKLNWKNVQCIQLKKSNAKELLHNPWYNVCENSSYNFFHELQLL